MTTPLLPRHWQLPKLRNWLIITILIALSWCVPASRALWDRADLWLFYSLNAPIAHLHTLALGWAIMNMRPVDALVGLLLFSFLLRGGWTVPAAQVRLTFIAMLMLLLWMYVLRISFTNLLDLFEWSRASPTESMADAVKLTQVFPGWDDKYHLKDGSPTSFPGDHASVLIIWAMWVSRFASSRKQWLVWTLTVLLSLPRLAAGAHWLSDDLVGGLAIAMLAYATAVYTPLLASLTSLLETSIRPMLGLLARLPVLKKMAFFNGL